MRFTKHSKQRIKERTGVRYQTRNKLFKEALKKGISPGNTADKVLQNYLQNKQHNSKVKLYKGYVFIYSKGGSLYTMYKAPENIRKREIWKQDGVMGVEKQNH